MHLLLVHSFLLAIGIAHASVIVYSPYVQQPSETVASASYTGVASYDNVILKPQPLPNPPSPTSFGVQLQTGTVPGVSIPHQGSLFGFSIELGFATQALGLNRYHSSMAWKTFGDIFSSGGRPVGVIDVQTIICDQTNNVDVPAPGTALVFISDQVLAESDQRSTMTFPTTAWTRSHNTTKVDPATLAASNGDKGIADALAGTTQGEGINDAFGLAHVLAGIRSLVNVCIFVCTFVCLESLLSYAVTGKSLIASVSDMTKNAR